MTTNEPELGPGLGPRKPRTELRHWSTYTSVGAWYADYRGYVPIQQGHGRPAAHEKPRAQARHIQTFRANASAPGTSQPDPARSSSVIPQTNASSRSSGPPPPSGSAAQSWSSRSGNGPTWWMRPCSVNAAIGSARVRFPRLAWTARYATSGSTVRRVVSTRSPPLLTSATIY